MRQTVRFSTGPGSKVLTHGGLVQFVQEMNALADTLNLTAEIKGRAASIVTDAAAMRFCRVTTRPILAAAALYVACREQMNPTTLRELAQASGTSPKEVGRCYTTILERMHIARPGLDDRGYVRHLVLRQGPPGEVYSLSEDIIKRSTLAGICGRNPMTLAAAALYIACCIGGVKVTQAEVADAAGVGEESVRECCKAIKSIGKGGLVGPTLTCEND